MTDIEKYMTPLEKEFETIQKSANKQIQDKLAAAAALINEAVAISEAHGIPFSARVSPLSNAYCPKSFKKKFGDVDKELMMDLCNYYSSYGEKDPYPGWVHSAVC